MHHRALGTSGLSFAPIVLGCNVFGWTTDEATSLSLLSAFVERGFSCIDTADVYSTWVAGHRGGESEQMIGRWLKHGGQRDKIIIATKVGMQMPEGKGLSAPHILHSVEGSLKRLGTDYIDLYQAHIDDSATPFEETLEAFMQLLKSGKVRAIGASNFIAPRLAEALGVAKEKALAAFVSLQPNYSLVTRSLYEGELQRLCIRENLGVIPYYALAAGFLTGKYRKESDIKGRARTETIGRFFNPRGLQILSAMDKIAARLDASVAQIALAWVLAQPGITAPIVSATSLMQLDEILGAAEIALDADALDMLDKASA
ncbi:MAG: aldo/keto reductase [Beijerinckiaceae bacterium]|nr:MAG: aldo/keto reductase [Beijerinckiaceae bacterium]